MPLEILTDFDGTLTQKMKGHGNSFSVLRDVMSDEGKIYSDALYAKYAPSEFNFYISKEEREEQMIKWWQEEFEGVVNYKVHLDDIKRASRSENLVLRRNVKELFEYAKSNNIPVLILTAGVADIIKYKLEYERIVELDENGKIKNNNIKIVGNSFAYDNDGYVREAMPPLVHTMNKYEIMREIDKKLHADVAIVIGDHPADILMCDKSNHSEVISFGFLNNKENKGDYDVYDTLYKNGDDNFEGILNKVREISRQ